MIDTTPLIETLFDRQAEALEAGRYDFARLLQDRINTVARLEMALMDLSDERG